VIHINWGNEMNVFTVLKQNGLHRCLGLVACLALSSVAQALPVLTVEIQGGNAISIGQTVSASLVVTNLGVDEVVTAFDVTVDFDEAVASSSGLQVNTIALDTDALSSGASLLGNGVSHNFFGTTNAGTFNSNTFADLKVLQGGASGTFTLASFFLTGVSAGSSFLSYASPFIFAIENSATLTVPLDLGDTAAGQNPTLTVTRGNDNAVPLPSALTLALLGVAGLARTKKLRRQ
jgi:hypothetical protein